MMLLDLFLSFFKIGLFTFGGGYAMIPMISDAVVAKNWITRELLIDFIAISESTPGPFAVNIATFVGMEKMGLAGATAATLGVVLPSFLIILIIAKFFLSFSKNRFVAAALRGLRPAVVGLIAAAAYSIGRAVLFSASSDGAPAGVNWKAVAILLIVFALSRLPLKKKLHPIALIGASAALGVVLYGFF